MIRKTIFTSILLAILALFGCYSLLRKGNDEQASTTSPKGNHTKTAEAREAPTRGRSKEQKPQAESAPKLVKAMKAVSPPQPPLVQAEKPKFDPRFEQPATKAGLFGPDDETMQRIADATRTRSQAEKLAAEEWARKNNWPLAGINDDGQSFEIMRLDDGGAPIYNATQNSDARISHNVHRLNQFDSPLYIDLDLSGIGWTVGLFENGKPRLSHHDFAYLENLNASRVTYLDQGDRCQDVLEEIQDHATHVLGTMIGNGRSNGSARGMAPLASAKAYNWCDDDAEMRSIGATGANQPDKIYVSNHSYGIVAGWVKLSPSNFLGDSFGGKKWMGYAGDSEPRWFGQYNTEAREYDKTCRLAPYLLPFVATGNNQGSEPSFLQEVQWPALDSSGDANPSPNAGVWGISAGSAPGPDGGDDGFDTLLRGASSKNIMSVGNLNDAVSSGSRMTSGITMVASSGFGPTDDGRIKPDIVGNGSNVLSANKDGDDSYGTKTGTSMATPGVAGTALLLHEHYTNSTGQYMRSATTKALLIHTATDILNPGPDYKSGWGLADGLSAVQHIFRHHDNPGGSHMREDFLSAKRTSLVLSFQASSPIKATLAWTDPEASVDSGLDTRSRRLINDLDLTIIDPNGNYYFAPQLNVNDPNANATYTSNDIDNVEKIGGSSLQTIPAIPGIYKLIVSYQGSLTELDASDNSVANPKQAFSLMLQGNDPDTTGTLAQALDNDEFFFNSDIPGTAHSFAYESNATFNDFDRAINAPISDSQTAAFETTITGPTTLKFRWGVSSEATFDFLRFYDNGTKIEEISGEVAGSTYTYTIPAGEHTLRWAYEKDSSRSSGLDQAWIDEVYLDGFLEGIDNFDYVWNQTGFSIEPWTREAFTATSIPTGDLGRGGAVQFDQFSEMTTTIEGPALVQFTMVQIAAGGALRANYTGGFVVHAAGNAYRRYSVLLGPGSNDFTFSWRNNLGESGSGFVDEFVVTPLPDTGTLSEAVDIPNGSPELTVESLSEAAWTPVGSGGAPVGRNGESDSSAIRTVFVPTSQFPNSTNNTAVVTTLEGPALVSFWWQCTGATDGKFEFQTKLGGSGQPFQNASPASVGPRVLEPIAGGTGWQQVHYELPPGSHDVRWAYTAGANDVEGTAWLDRLVVQPGLMHLARGLDHWSQRWETYGDAAWAAEYDESNGGLDSTSHGDLGNSQSTTLATTVVGPKKLFFTWKVSSEVGFDYLRFTLDGEEVVPGISGEVPWANVQVDIPAGNHILRWTYSKDGSLSGGSDRGWVDGIALLRPDFGIDSVIRSVGFNQVNAKKDQTAGFFMETSTDLRNWSVIGANSGSINGSGMIPPGFGDYVAIVPAGGPRQFYRLRFEPEVAITIENADFELPLLSVSNPNVQSGPGWTSDNDAAGKTVFEFVPNFSASGSNHFSVDLGSFTETKDGFSAFHGVHSVTAAIGNRSGFTGPTNRSIVALFRDTELSQVSVAGNDIPVGTFENAYPVSYDSFGSSINESFSYDVRLISEGSRSNFDKIRIVTEAK